MISYINVHLHLHLHSSKTGHSTFVLSTIDVLVLLYWDSLTGSVCQLPVVVLSTKERNELLLGPDTLMDADILCIQLTYSRAPQSLVDRLSTSAVWHVGCTTACSVGGLLIASHRLVLFVIATRCLHVDECHA